MVRAPSGYENHSQIPENTQGKEKGWEKEVCELGRKNGPDLDSEKVMN